MKELPKSYSPDPIEEKWYDFWEAKGFFHADPLSKREPYCIVLPPPNITGVLHMGHAFGDTLQDILIRWKRMSRYEVLWVPGTDHAGIATQTVVEKDLIAKKGKSRRDFSREEFLSHVWKWKESREHDILRQLKRLGCSCDWMRHRFTMDKDASLAVRTQFKKMYEDGLIYRGDYLINWDPMTQTALADDEVEYEERDTSLWYIRYAIEENDRNLIIATTRPETMLGDVAVAVSPKDERYRRLVGKKAILPLMNRPIPIIADPFVDPEFGTGAVKITPAHDPNDYEIGLRHELPFINIMTPDGKINENGREYEGLTMEEAREEVVRNLKALGLIEKIEPYKHRIGFSYRSKAIIEPYLSKQWFVKVTDFKKELVNVVKQDKVKLIPSSWKHTYFHWIDHLRDWCISRQLWWGHRIPIWYHRDDPERMICYEEEGEPPEVQAHPDEWTQDEDVLDTWFSSSLWPFSALGWPHQTNELKKFYPNTTLITGHDILFFWVARMILMGLYTTGKPPFKETALFGLIYGKSYWKASKEGGITYISAEEKKEYDLGKPVPKGIESRWEKMSKSKGNVIDPSEIIDLYGADATRIALTLSATQSRQIDLDRRRFEECKHFINKIWNGSRFVLMNLEGLTGEEFAKGLDHSHFRLEDRWILSRLSRMIEIIDQDLTKYHFDRAAHASYSFFWDEFCAYYLEIAKHDLSTLKQKLLATILLTIIRLMHPIIPFITEEIFHLLKEHMHPFPTTSSDPHAEEALLALSAPSCTIAPFPMLIEPQDIDKEVEEQFQIIRNIIYGIRNIRAEMQLPPYQKTDLILISKPDSPTLTLFQTNEHIIRSLIHVKAIHINPKEVKGLTSSATIDDLQIIIPLPEELLEKEKQRLKKEKEKMYSQLEAMERQLSNPDFLEKAPQELVEKTKATYLELKEKLK